MRQMGGFQGRPNKDVDTCYSFWIGASLKILNAFELSNYEANRSYIMETENSTTGGFSKWPNICTDPFHTYMAICALSFLDEPDLNEVMPSLNISMNAYHRLKLLHQNWNSMIEQQQQQQHLENNKNYYNNHSQTVLNLSDNLRSKLNLPHEC